MFKAAFVLWAKCSDRNKKQSSRGAGAYLSLLTVIFLFCSLGSDPFLQSWPCWMCGSVLLRFGLCLFLWCVCCVVVPFCFFDVFAVVALWRLNLLVLETSRWEPFSRSVPTGLHLSFIVSSSPFMSLRLLQMKIPSKKMAHIPVYTVGFQSPPKKTGLQNQVYKWVFNPQ